MQPSQRKQIQLNKAGIGSLILASEERDRQIQGLNRDIGMLLERLERLENSVAALRLESENGNKTLDDRVCSLIRVMLGTRLSKIVRSERRFLRYVLEDAGARL